jgi:hypothetical protein
LIHSIQFGHHEPGCSFAFFSQASSEPRPGLPPVQYWYLPLFGGLTTPAMWPDPDSTNFTGPPKNFEPRNADFAGAMWSSRVARLYSGTLTLPEIEPDVADRHLALRQRVAEIALPQIERVVGGRHPRRIGIPIEQIERHRRLAAQIIVDDCRARSGRWSAAC